MTNVHPANDGMDLSAAESVRDAQYGGGKADDTIPQVIAARISYRVGLEEIENGEISEPTLASFQRVRSSARPR